MLLLADALENIALSDLVVILEVDQPLEKSKIKKSLLISTIFFLILGTYNHSDHILGSYRLLEFSLVSP